MPIRVDCSVCGRSYRVRGEYAGKRIACKQCHAPIPISGNRVDDEFDEFSTGEDAVLERRSAASARPPRKKKKTTNSVVTVWVVLGVLAVVIAISTLAGLLTRFGDAFNDYEAHQELADQMIVETDEIISAMESIHDRQSAKGAAERINAAIGRMDVLAEKEKRLLPLSPHQHERLTRYFTEKQSGYLARMTAVRARSQHIIEASPEMQAALARMKQARARYDRGTGWR